MLPTMKPLLLMALCLSVFTAGDSQISSSKILTLCTDTGFNFLINHDNTDPVAIQTENFGADKYTPGKTCNITLDFLMSDYFTYILVDYVALAASDAIYISDGTNTTSITYMDVNSTATLFVTRNSSVTITLQASSTVSSTGFRAYAWVYKPGETASLGSTSVSTDTVISSNLNESSIALQLLTDGYLYMYTSSSTGYSVRSGGPCKLCGVPVTTPVDLTYLAVEDADSTDVVFNIAQNNSNQFTCIYRKKDTTSASPLNNEVTLTLNAVHTITFPETLGTLYPNNMQATFVLKLDAANPAGQKVSFQFNTFETEANHDYLSILDSTGKELKRLSGPISDASGNWYYGVEMNDRWFFGLDNIDTSLTLKFVSNGAIRGAGFSVDVKQGDYTAPSTTPAPSPTTPFPGAVTRVNVTDFYESHSSGYPTQVAANELQLWQFLPANLNDVVVFYLLDFQGIFAAQTGAQLVIYSGDSASCNPWDVLATFDSSSYESTSKKVVNLLAGPLSARLFSGNTSLTSSGANNVGIRFLVATINGNDTTPTTAQNVTATVDGNTALTESTYGYPRFVYPKTVQYFAFTPAADCYLLFVLLDAGHTFTEIGTKLTVYKGAAEPTYDNDVYWEYNKVEDLNKKYIKGEKGVELRVRYESTSGMAANADGTLGVQFLILGFDDLPTPATYTPTVFKSADNNYRISAHSLANVQKPRNGVIIF